MRTIPAAAGLLLAAAVMFVIVPAALSLVEAVAL